MTNAVPQDHVSAWNERSVLVTGATGLLGSWLVEALVARKAHVVCLVRDWVPHSRFHAPGIRDQVQEVRGDISNPQLIERVLGEYEVRTVFHLAAQTIVSVASRNPLATFETNIKGTWTLLEACRRSPLVSETIVASSDKAYGSQTTLPYSESMPLHGGAPYDVSKSCADLIAQSYAHTYGLRVCVTRCGNFFGGGDLNWSRLVPGVMRDLLAGRAPIVRSDGSLVRDYLYIEDGVSAYLRLAEAMMNRPELAGRAFNFSLEEPLTVLQMLSLIIRAVGVDRPPVVLGESANEIAAQYLDSSAARQDLGWRPEIGMDEGLRRTAAWYRDHLAVR